LFAWLLNSILKTLSFEKPRRSAKLTDKRTCTTKLLLGETLDKLVGLGTVFSIVTGNMADLKDAYQAGA